MFDSKMLSEDVTRVREEDSSQDTITQARRAVGLRFLVEAGTGQTLEDVRAVFQAIHPDFEVEPLYPQPLFKQIPAGEAPPFPQYLSGHVAFLKGIQPDDLSQNAFDLGRLALERGGFNRVDLDAPTPNLCPDIQLPMDEADALKVNDAWALNAMKVAQAWRQAGGNRGRGVKIAHPDTGWTNHVEWDAGGLDHANQRNFIPGEDPNNAHDPCNEGSTYQPGHGTHTGAVMVCRGGIREDGGGTTPPGRITGVAADAMNVPIRAVNSVILYPSQVEVARAIEYAVQQRFAVISLSLGGVALWAWLGGPINHAVDNNHIIVSASGNYPDWVLPGLRFTVEPANYWQCIGVAGSTPEDKPWESSGRVPHNSVDIAAPAHQVPTASAVCGSRPRNGYTLGSGTSYATAHMAGVAALWLSHHYKGWYTGQGRAVEVFREHIRRTARKPEGWSDWFGAGIVDAHQLIATRPAAVEAQPHREAVPSAAKRLAMLIDGESTYRALALMSAVFLNQHDEVTDQTEKLLEPWVNEIIYLLFTKQPLAEAIREGLAEFPSEPKPLNLSAVKVAENIRNQAVVFVSRCLAQGMGLQVSELEAALA